MTERLQKLRLDLKNRKLDAILISSNINRGYLTNFKGSLGYFLLIAGVAYLFVDSRYYVRAKKEVSKNISIQKLDKNYYENILKLLRAKNIDSLAIEADLMTVSEYDNLKKKLKSIKLKKTKALVKTIRAQKDRDEIKELKKAINITDKTFEYICKFIQNNHKKGLTEKQIALEISKHINKLGGDDVSFDTIVASGQNSAIPHHLSSGKKIKSGEFILIDFGAIVNGYHADMTRMIFIGKPQKKHLDLYNQVLTVQTEIIKEIKAGANCNELHERAVSMFEGMGMKDKFTHSLGHGVGLEIHELPSLGPGKMSESLKLKAGMVFSIEPGLYIEGFGGVRIEDLVLVKEDGYEILSKSTKKLVVI